MNRENIVKIVKQIKEITRLKVTGGNVMVCCPFARWTHGKGRDSRPSMGIKIIDDDESVYNCFACGMKGTLHDLADEINYRTEGDYPDLADEVLELEVIDFDAVIDRSGKTPSERAAVREELSRQEIRPEAELVAYRGSVPKYALDRGLTLEACKAWELGHDKERQRLVFPLRRKKDRALVGLVGRTYIDEEPKYLDLVGFPKAKFLFGEWMVPDEADAVVVVEGQIDVIAVWQAGFPAVGIMGAFASAEQTRKLEYMEKKVILFPDGDLAGKKWANALGDDLRDLGIQVRDAYAGDETDPSDLPPDGIKGVIERAGIRI